MAIRPEPSEPIVDQVERPLLVLAKVAREPAPIGDRSDQEAILASQVVALNAMFTQLADLTSRMTIVDQIDRFTRLAFKAQGQCRATAETLALMKNPPVFARQANIAHGPQQVNNGTPPARSGSHEPSRASNPESGPIKLLEAADERMDTGATRASGRSDQKLAPLGALHRTTKRRG